MATITQRGLGKGLSALISENYVQPAAAAASAPQKGDSAAASGVYTLSAKKLHAGKYQPRTHFSEAELSELAESIRQNGIMQPIVVRPSSRTADMYEIIAGERRWRAAQLAALQDLPVIIRELTDKQALELSLIENIQRQDLSPLDEANGYQRLIEEFEYTQEELAGSVGKSRSHIANLLRLLSLPEEVKDMMQRGDLTMGHARALVGLPNAVELANDIVRKGLNVRQVEKVSREVQGQTKKNVARPRAGSAAVASGSKDPDILALEESLSENLGLRVSIYDRGQSGEITLSYDSLSQLDEILRRLSGSL
jgi:ParB family transcriptional regulator, chromosome partitioning protein